MLRISSTKFVHRRVGKNVNKFTIKEWFTVCVTTRNTVTGLMDIVRYKTDLSEQDKDALIKQYKDIYSIEHVKEDIIEFY